MGTFSGDIPREPKERSRLVPLRYHRIPYLLWSYHLSLHCMKVERPIRGKRTGIGQAFDQLMESMPINKWYEEREQRIKNKSFNEIWK